MSGVAVVADHDNQNLNPSTRAALTAAQQLGSPVTLLVFGHNCENVAKQASHLSGVQKVILLNQPSLANSIAENVAKAVGLCHAKQQFTHVVGTTSSVSKSSLPRFAVKQDVQSIGDVVSIKSADTFVRPVYAGNALSTIQSLDALKVVLVRPTAFAKAVDAAIAAPVELVSDDADAGLSQWLKNDFRQSARPELVSSKVVVSGGRGLKASENFRILEELADIFGGAVGATRAAVDAGMAPNEMQIGQTGKVVAPELYIAVGLSGAIQHWAGMKDSKTIVAINKDAEAPIMQVADIGIASDLFKFVPELTQKLKASKA